MKRFSLFIVLNLISVSAFANPAIHVGSLYEFMEPEQSTLLKRIRNSGSSTAFVRIAISEINFRENSKPIETPLDMTLLAQGKAEGIIASPARMMIPASGMQANRLVYMGNRNKERYFRVRFTPVVPASGKEFGLTEEDSLQYKESMSAGVNVLAGYGAIVTVRPQSVSYKTSLSEQSDSFIVSNNGNSTVIIEGIYECNKESLKCGNPFVRHLIPGASFQQHKKNGYSYRFTLIEGAKKKVVHFGQK